MYSDADRMLSTLNTIAERVEDLQKSASICAYSMIATAVAAWIIVYKVVG